MHFPGGTGWVVSQTYGALSVTQTGNCVELPGKMWILVGAGNVTEPRLHTGIVGTPLSVHAKLDVASGFAQFLLNSPAFHATQHVAAEVAFRHWVTPGTFVAQYVS